MYTSIKSLVTLATCLCSTAALNIIQANVPENSCLKQTLNEVAKNEKSVIINWSHRINETIKDDILQSFRGKVDFVIINWTIEITINWHIHRNPGTILIVASNRKDIERGILSLLNKNVWKYNSKFIVLYLDGNGYNKKSTNATLIKNIFKTFANLNALNVRIIYKYNEEISEFTWFPYEDGNCETINRVRLISECKDIYHNYFKKLDATRLESRCSITAGILPMEPYSFYSKSSGFSKGIDVYLLRAFSNRCKFNLELQPMNKNDSRKRAQFHQKTFHIVSGAHNKFQEILSQSTEFYFDDLAVCVKKADLLRPWLSFFLVIDWKMWMLGILLIYLNGALVFLYYKKYHHPENFHYCTGMALFSNLTVPIPYNPTHGIARIHLGISLIYGLLWAATINAFLVTRMTKSHYEDQISKFEDLIYYENNILTDLNVVPVQSSGNDKISSYIKSNYENCYDMIRCLNQLFERTKVAVIVPRKLAKHFESTTKLPVFCFSESFSKMSRAFTLNRPNSFLLDKMNSFIMRAMETGHLKKWETDSAEDKIFDNNSEGPVVLTFGHLAGVFIVYVFGNTLALLTFIVERMAIKKIGKSNSRIWKWVDILIVRVERSVCIPE